MKKSTYVHCALISAALASCNRPLYQQKAPEDSPGFEPYDPGPAGIPAPGGIPGQGGISGPGENPGAGENPRADWLPKPGPDTLNWLSSGDSSWYYAFRDINLDFQIYSYNGSYMPPYRGRWYRMPLAHILRSGFGRPAFHAGA